MEASQIKKKKWEKEGQVWLRGVSGLWKLLNVFIVLSSDRSERCYLRENQRETLKSWYRWSDSREVAALFGLDGFTPPPIFKTSHAGSHAWTSVSTHDKIWSREKLFGCIRQPENASTTATPNHNCETNVSFFN